MFFISIGRFIIILHVENCCYVHVDEIRNDAGHSLKTKTSNGKEKESGVVFLVITQLSVVLEFFYAFPFFPIIMILIIIIVII